MGGRVSALMTAYNARTMTPHPLIGTFKAYGRMNVPVGAVDSGSGCSPVYRMNKVSEEAHRQMTAAFYNEPNWLHTVAQRSAANPNSVVLSYRTVERIEDVLGKDAHGKERTVSRYHMKPERTNMTFGEMWSTVTNLTRGMKSLGVGAGDRVAIYEETRWEWLVAMYAIWLGHFVAVTAYSNLGLDALAYALKETECKAIICNGKQVPRLVELLHQAALQTTIVYLGELPDNFTVTGHTCLSWDDVVRRGSESPSIEVTLPTNNDDLALIMYTSGTSGVPKGVMHTHGSIASGIRAIYHRIQDLHPHKEPDETYCCYLPLAHIMEFAVVNSAMCRGALIGFGSPRTLTNENAIPHGDLLEFTPKSMFAVPRVYDGIKKAVEARLPPPGTIKRQIFEAAYASRHQALKDGKETPYWNRVVFNASKKVMGDKMFCMLSGGGPLSSATQEFINVVLGGPLLIQGYGLTETVSCGTTQRLGDTDNNSVGQLVITAELKLKDTAEYKHTDTPLPRGEILLRGPFLFRGYYKQPELTAEAIDAEGWFHTGDVGAITERGSLRIIGRVKGLAKNVLGEYIAMEALEALYVQNPLCVPNGVCVLVHPQRPYIAALVLTDAAKAAAFAKEHGLSGSLPELLDNPAFHAKAAQSLAATATAAQRKPFECVKFVRVLADEWTPEGGMVTPSLKLKRRVLEEKYADVIAKLFETE